MRALSVEQAESLSLDAWCRLTDAQQRAVVEQYARDCAPTLPPHSYSCTRQRLAQLKRKPLKMTHAEMKAEVARLATLAHHCDIGAVLEGLSQLDKKLNPEGKTDGSSDTPQASSTGRNRVHTSTEAATSASSDAADQ